MEAKFIGFGLALGIALGAAQPRHQPQRRLTTNEPRVYGLRASYRFGKAAWGSE